MTTLNEIFDQLRKLGDNMESEDVNLASLLPEGDHHRTAVFIRLPWPGIVGYDEEVQERITKLLASINKPDTIKCDVYTIIGDQVLSGYQPHTEMTAKGVFDPNEHSPISSKGYVLQLTVDVVKPAAMEATINHLAD